MLKLYDKNFTCLDDNGNTINVNGIPRKVTMTEISSLQRKMSVCKGCKIFAVYVMDDNDKDNQINIEDTPILKYFKDIFFGRSS